MNGILNLPSNPIWCTNEHSPFVRTGFETYATAAATSAIARTRDMIITASCEDIPRKEDIPKKEDTIVLLNAVKLLKVESL